MDKDGGSRTWPKHIWLLIVFVVAASMLMVAALPAVMAGKPDKPPVTSDFTLSTLDSRGAVGGDVRTVIGGAPGYVVHITYYDATNHALKYAKKVGSSWTISTLATVGNRFYYPMGGVADLALDANGNVHIIYIDCTKSNELEYINNAGGTWSTPIALIDGVQDVMGQPSFAIDSAGIFHVCYWQSDQMGNWITYGIGSPGSMVTRQIAYGDNDNALSWYMSMAVDSNNVAHVIDVNFDTYVLTYLNSIDWSKSVELSGVEIHANIAIGLGNSVHLSYFAYPDGVLNYAYLDGGSFHSTVVDPTTDTATNHPSAIAIDSNGCVHISYMDYPAGSFKPILKYATNVGGSWNIKVVDGSSNAATDNDIAVGPGAKVRIAYYNLSASDLKYAEST